ncbi:hypothetical protein QO004_005948 [Rhizobium mesoamericanum]|uniref:hypothetical protein n=1 Tax=Rhizobium mesoamericanum TaxID=1079800 RepID=UPI00277DAB09|nr:hypothetical protein [Rhizobium mesoamericanum]MDQ0564130.1 hypothetical protein [Rhizobium mesoamericanum]
MANYNALLNCVNNAAPGGAVNSIQFNAGSGTFGGVDPLENGELIIGSTGNAPVAQTITAGSGITITNAPGSITISASSSQSIGSGGLYSGLMSETPTSSGTGLVNWINQRTATVSDSAVGICINAPTAGSANNISGRFMPAPTPPYKIKALIANTRSSSQYGAAGIGWYDGTSKLHLLSYALTSSGVPDIEVTKWNNVTTWSANDFTSSPNGFAQPIWLQLTDDGTTISFAFSQDGSSFLPVYSVAKSAAFLGPSGYSNVGFFVNPQNGASLATIMSWTRE